MSLQLGANFPNRWLAAPQEVRRQFLRDLNNVCLLLDPKTDFDEWQIDQIEDPDHIVPMKTNINTSPNQDAAKVSLPVNSLVALEQRLLKQADQVIERALDPIRAELRSWIQEQIRQEIGAMGSQG
ncbi:MAG: hypothetical protein KGO49_08750 [Gammaproteobacteria bacterium]|nr:hypothetical protein [Gammaproteobacteria bacterium]